MFHGVGFPGPNQRLEEPFLRERLDGILADQQRIGSVIEEHSNLTGDQIAELFRGAQTKDAAYAAGCGIVNEIRDAQVPAGCPVVALVFERQPV